MNPDMSSPVLCCFKVHQLSQTLGWQFSVAVIDNCMISDVLLVMCIIWLISNCCYLTFPYAILHRDWNRTDQCFIFKSGPILHLQDFEIILQSLQGHGFVCVLAGAKVQIDLSKQCETRSSAWECWQEARARKRWPFHKQKKKTHRCELHRDSNPCALPTEDCGLWVASWMRVTQWYLLASLELHPRDRTF